jgi:GT2 family glycosyltransferase
MTSVKPRIFIIILNWNGVEDTCECVLSAQQINYQNYEVIIVDNGSEDNSVKVFKEKFSEICIIETGQNLGYAGGNNAGIAYALEKSADYILILNNDATVDSSILDNFIEIAERHPNAGILGAKIYFSSEPKKIWFAGGAWLPEIAKFTHIGYGEADDPTYDLVRTIDYACGCALFVKADVFRKIGLLETKFFLTWEETDFCYKARRAGFECLFAPSAHVWHKVSASFKGGEAGLMHEYFMTRNRLLWIERNQTILEKLKIYKSIILPELSRYIRAYLSPRTGQSSKFHSKVHLAAIRDYLIRKFGNCPAWIRTM